MKAAEQDCKTVILVGLEQHDSTHICSHLMSMNVFAACVPSVEDFLMLMTQTKTIPVAIIFKLNCVDLERFDQVVNKARQQFLDTPIVFPTDGHAEAAGVGAADITRSLKELVP